MPASASVELKQATSVGDEIVDKSGTTTFYDDATVATTTTRTDLSIQNLGPPTVDANSVADFLAKPLLINHGVITLAASANSNVTFFDIAPQLSQQLYLKNSGI
jgi:hypothetical protein